MKYILWFLILVILIFVNPLVFAQDLTSKISSLWYEWNLSKTSVINIKWENLEKCTNLIVNWKKVEISKKDKSIISFLAWDNFHYEWVVKVECAGRVIDNKYNFPYIETISWLNNYNSNRQITIIWHNFSNIPKVILKWWNFSKVFLEDRLIVWLLPAKLDNNEVFITSSNWLKSNIFKLDLKIPKINYIFSHNWFTRNGNIFVYWDNLNDYNNAQVYFWTKVIWNTTYNKKEWFITFPAELINWKALLKIVSNWFESNSVDIKVTSWKPIIENTSVKNQMIWLDWKVIQKKYLVLNIKNLPDNQKTITIYNNKVVIPKYTIIKNDIYVELDKFVHWNNYIQIELFWDKSNVVNFKNESILPNPVSLDVWKIENKNRIFYLYIQNFNIKEDKIYLNWAEKKSLWCVNNICSIVLPETIIKWTFTVWKWNLKNDKAVKFDLTSYTYTWKSPLLLWYKINNNDWLVKNNTDIDINWLWFSNTDSVVIWKETVAIKYYNSKNWSFKIPSSLEAWEYDLSIKNKDWIISNALKIIVTKNAKPKILIEKLKLDKIDFDLNTINTWSLYTLSIDNKLEDIVLKNISFKVENYKKEMYLSNFKLKIWNIEYDSANISSNWIINFHWRYDFPRSATSYKISLLKDSNYINIWEFNVNLIIDDLDFEKHIDWSKYNKIEYINIWSNKIKIVDNNKYINCKDSKTDNINCNKVLNIIPVKVETKVVEPIKTDTKTTDTKKVETKTTDLKK